MTHTDMIQKLRAIGFRSRPDKDGVLELRADKHGHTVDLVVLVSAKDTSMLLSGEGQVVPFKMKFNRNFAGAYAFILDYLNISKGEQHVSNKIH